MDSPHEGQQRPAAEEEDDEQEEGAEEEAMHGVLHDAHMMELVFAALGGLTQRHRLVPAVCRRWHEILHSPSLLRRTFASLDCTRPATLPAFCAWLRRHAAPHVQRLQLELRAGGMERALRSEADVELLYSAVQQCGRLADLRLHVDAQMVVSRDLLGPLCGRLTSLELDACSRSRFESAGTSIYAIGLEELTALRELSVSGPAVELHRSGLPPGLTALKLEGYRDLTSLNRHSLPRQLEGLRHLRSLALVGVYATTPDCFNPLLTLPALEQLSLARCTHLPACLPRLTRLRALALRRAPLHVDSAAAELGAALRSGGLAALTHLVLRDMSFGAGGLPPEVAGLAQLQRFCWLRGPLHPGLTPAQAAEHVAPPPPLPIGPWLAGLREAALEVAVATASLAVLQAGAAQLEALAVHGRFGDGASQLAVAHWAVEEHLSLRRLALCKPAAIFVGRHETELGVQQLSEAVWALRLRPTLAVEYSGALLRQAGRLRDSAAEGGGASSWSAATPS